MKRTESHISGSNNSFFDPRTVTRGRPHPLLFGGDSIPCTGSQAVIAQEPQDLKLISGINPGRLFAVITARITES